MFECTVIFLLLLILETLETACFVPRDTPKKMSKYIHKNRGKIDHQNNVNFEEIKTGKKLASKIKFMFAVSENMRVGWWGPVLSTRLTLPSTEHRIDCTKY